ncbi:MAG: hypothetical protein JWQ71_1626, partial [Pedosphaera sp.]|nr:hypothetical protein [Pedosphaera sp.]
MANEAMVSAAMVKTVTENVRAIGPQRLKGRAVQKATK